jgi:hypothetical protein
MGGVFQIDYRQNNGNLHLRLQGLFDGSSAWELINLIHGQYDGQGRVFVDTKGLAEVHPSGSQILQSNLDQGIIPFNNIYFKGEMGRELAPSGCRVLVQKILPSLKCKGRCRNCQCAVTGKLH